MSARARHEARWTHESSTVRGNRRRNRGWVVLLCFAVIVVLATVAYREFMRFETVSYELRRCEQALTEDSSWADVQAAGCEPVAIASDDSLLLQEESALKSPDRTDGSTWLFDEVPVNSPAHSFQLQTSFEARSGVVVEPTNQRIRTELSSDASGTRWTAFIGSRGPTEYWILLTP